MKTLLGLFPYVLFFLSLTLPAELRTLEATKGAVEEWMKGSRSLSKYSVDGSEVFAVEGFEVGLHVFRLLPAGYLIANAETRLPLLVAFSGESSLSLVDTPENTLRALLESHVRGIPERLEALALPQPMSSAEPQPMSDVYVAPMLGTAWNQTNPYNLLMPAVDDAWDGYDGRAPVGCVATAYAQILNFHRWPVRGWGGHRYTDSSGPVTGTHSVTFNTEYDWDNMLPGYSAYGYNPPEAAAAVSKLMWDLVVAKEADIEADGTSAVTLFLGQQLNRHHFMETPLKYTSSAGAETHLQAELQSGTPALVGITGHVVVADGLDISGGTTLYHIQYGWGGSNDGWFAADAIPGGGLDAVIVGIRPSLMPFATEGPVSAPANQSATLSWILPREREDDLQALRVYRAESESGTWSAEADQTLHTEAQDWALVTDANRGNVWFAGPNGPATLLLSEQFVPTASSMLTFWMQYRLGTATLHVQVSTDGGQSFTTIGSYNNNYPLSWAQHSHSLEAYAGQTLRLRFYLTSGTYYPGTGGVWLDTFSVNNCAWTEWAFWKQLGSFQVDRFSSDSTLLDEAENFTTFAKTSTSTNKDWQIAAAETGNGFYKAWGGDSTKKYHLTSGWITPQADARLVLRAKYLFYDDGFRVSVSTDGITWNSLAEFFGEASWQDLKISLAAYAEQAIRIRFEYLLIGSSFYSAGGLWIEDVRLETLTNPELEGQPLHRTLVTDLELGEGTHTLAATAVDTGGTEHRLSPAFTLNLTPPVTSRGTLHSWLVTHGGVAPAASNETFELADLDDSADPGFPLWQHYFAGTTPGNPLAADTTSYSAGTVTIHWVGQPGRSYRILRTSDLSQSPDLWSVRGSVNGVSENQPLSFSETPAEPAPWFYALDVSPTVP